MNVSRRQAILSAWEQFTARLTILANRGDELERGEIKTDNGQFYVQWQGGPPADDPFARIMFTLGAKLMEREFTIDGTVKVWLQRLPGTPRKNLNVNEFRFVLTGDGIALQYGGKILTPSECADSLWNYEPGTKTAFV